MTSLKIFIQRDICDEEDKVEKVMRKIKGEFWNTINCMVYSL